MKIIRFKNLMRTLMATCLIATASVSSVSAQTTTTATPAANESIDVTEQSSTWIQVLQANGIDIPTGADGVVISNGEGGNITASLDAIVTQADTTVINAGNIAGGFNAINFVNGSGTGSVTNLSTGVISSDSRAINIGGSVAVENAGQIVGTGDQRNGTVYSDSVANNFSVNNSGVIDAGAGNQGSGVALEIADRTTADIVNSGTIQGRTNAPGVSSTSGLSGDGVRLANFGAAADRVFDGTITNEASGVISSESDSGTTAGLRVANTIGFQGKLDNEGLIEGQRNGLYFGNAVDGLGGDHTGGVVNNSGRIESQSRALNIDGTGLEVNNSGSILGTGDQRNGTVYADSTAQDFELNNSGSVDAGEGNEGAAFSVELSESGNDFSINNSGTLAGRGNAGAGVATAGDGIRLERTRVDGALDGTTTGLFTGDITNSGTISSEGANGTVGGFRAVNGTSFQGTLTNEADGEISGEQNGVYFGNATPAGGGDHTGGVVQNEGTISSGSRALNIDGTGLEVNNSGSILGTGDQRNGTVYADSTAQDFDLNNSGSIDAGAGNQGAGFSAELSEAGNDFSINNSGTIAGRGDAGAGDATAGDGIRLERTRVAGALDGTTTGLFTGDITNSGTISSEGANGTVGGFRAVNGTSFQGTLTNEADGEISGEQNGVYFGNATPAGGGDHTGGVVRNKGTISSGSRALNIDGEGLAVVNEGSIVGTGNQRNGTVYSDDTANNFSLDNSGLIDAGVGNAGSGVSLSVGDSLNATIDNSGTIQGRTQAGAPLGSADAQAGDGLRLEGVRGTDADGNVTFAAGAFTGTISNSGKIASGDNTAGTVAGVRAVNGLSFQGTLDNTGVISGTTNGLYFGNAVNGEGADHTGGVVNNSGVISSDSRALNIDGTGLEVNNEGSILGTGNQRNGTVYADSTAQDFTLNNRGSIDAGAGNEGAGFSAELSATGNDFTINNSGELRGRGTAGAGLATAGDGIRLERTRVDGALDGSTTGLFTGTINNSGIVTSEGDSGTTGGFRAVNGVSFQGTLNNTGTISGVQNGVYFGNPNAAGGGDHTGGVVNNFGVISSDSRAFNLDGEGLQVNNHGDILATGAQRNGTFYVDGTANNFSLNNSGSIDATGGSGSGLSIQVGNLDGDVQSGSIVNSGSIIGSGDSGFDAGIRLFSGATNTVFNGDIVNEVGGLISSDGSPAVLIEEGVQFDGSLINAGQIDGSIFLASGDLDLLDSSLLSLTIDSLSDFDTVDIGGDLTFGGSLELNFLDSSAFEIGQTIDLFDFGSALGSFDNVFAGPLALDLSNLASQGTVTFAAAPGIAAVPEPSSFVVLALGGGLALLRRRRS